MEAEQVDVPGGIGGQILVFDEMYADARVHGQAALAQEVVQFIQEVFVLRACRIYQGDAYFARSLCRNFG